MCWKCSCKMVAGVAPFSKDESPILAEHLCKLLEKADWKKVEGVGLEYAVLLPRGKLSILEKAATTDKEGWKFSKEEFEKLKAYCDKKEMNLDGLVELLNAKNPLNSESKYFRYIWKDNERVWIANDFRTMEGMLVLNGNTDKILETVDWLIEKN